MTPCLGTDADKPCYAWFLVPRALCQLPVKGIQRSSTPDESHVIWDGDDVDVLERPQALVYFGRDDSARRVWDSLGLR